MSQKKDQSTGKGTRYTPKETEQRSYFLPPGLGDFFKDVCNGNPSTGIRGAMIIYAACRRFSDLRERAIRAANQMDFKEAVDLIEKELMEAVPRRYLQDYIESLPKAEQAKLLAQARKERGL